VHFEAEVKCEECVEVGEILAQHYIHNRKENNGRNGLKRNWSVQKVKFPSREGDGLLHFA